MRVLISDAENAYVKLPALLAVIATGPDKGMPLASLGRNRKLGEKLAHYRSCYRKRQLKNGQNYYLCHASEPSTPPPVKMVPKRVGLSAA
jgi:hypothetical protein